MARVEFSGLDQIDGTFAKLERMDVKKIVMAGADAAIGVLETVSETHVVTGAMKRSIEPGVYRETLGGGSIEVYPQGLDSRGVRNYLKAKKINEGYRKDKKGKGFMTGSATKAKLQTAEDAAMSAEANKLFKEAGG